jgi:ribonuclease BN (tRNA processing enzyme)
MLMRLHVLGASGAEFPGQNPPAFLVDEFLLLDAGTIGAVLDEEGQSRIRHILLTHAHLDHIRSIPFLADNIVLMNMKHSVSITSIPPVLNALNDSLLNNLIWPDFTKIPSAENAVIILNEITVGKPFKVNDYEVTAYEVNHSIPAIGFVIEDSGGRRLLYTGDTGPTTSIWEATEIPVHCAIIEVSMPNSMEEMAEKTGHLTASLLAKELEKMKNVPERICITHPKPQHLETILEEVMALGHEGTAMLKDGEVLEI